MIYTKLKIKPSNSELAKNFQITRIFIAKARLSNRYANVEVFIDCSLLIVISFRSHDPKSFALY